MNTLSNAINIDIVEENKPEPVVNKPVVIDKDELLADVPLEDGDSPEEDVVEFIAKPKPETTDIFDDKINEVIEDLQTEDKPIPEVKVVKEAKAEQQIKPKKKRKPMSEEHKAKLAISREKAIARRKFLAEQRKIEKQQAQLLKDQEQLLKQKEMDKKLKALQSQASSLQEPEPKVEPKTSLQGLSLEDIEKVQLNAIMSYEMVRKKRKEEKKKKQVEDKAKQDIMDTIKQAKPSWYVDNSPFNNCF